MKLSKAFEGFTIARISEGMSPSTAENYSYPITKLITRLGDPDITEITLNDLRSFLHWYATSYFSKYVEGDLSFCPFFLLEMGLDGAKDEEDRHLENCVF